MDRDPDRRPPSPFSLFRRPRKRWDPDEFGIGRRHPVLTLVALWVGVVAALIGLSYVLPRQLWGVIALIAFIGLLTTVRI